MLTYIKQGVQAIKNQTDYLYKKALDGSETADSIGDKVSDILTDTNELQGYANNIAPIPGTMYSEYFQDNDGIADGWAQATVGNGAIGYDSTSAFGSVEISAGGANNDTAALYTEYSTGAAFVMNSAPESALDSYYDKFIIEFLGMITGVAGTSEDGECFFGVSEAGNTDGNDVDIGGWRYNGSAWEIVTDDNGTETETAITLNEDTWYIFRMIFTSGQIIFEMNGSTVATHTTNLPAATNGKRLNFNIHLLSDGGDSPIMYFRNYRHWYEKS